MKILRWFGTEHTSDNAGLQEQLLSVVPELVESENKQIVWHEEGQKHLGNKVFKITKAYVDKRVRLH